MRFKLKNAANLIIYVVIYFGLLFAFSLNAQDSLLVGKEFRVANGSDPTSMPDIATLANGSFVICWQDDSLDVVAHIYEENGKRIGGKIKANSKPNTFHPEPAIAALNNGGFIICWHHFVEDSARGDLYGQLFASDGTKIGEEFFVIPPPPERLIPFRSDVISLVNGDIVVAWQVYNGDGYQYGLFAQRLTQDGKRIGDQFQINSFPHDANETEICLAPTPDSGFVATWFREWVNDGSLVLNENVALQLFDKNGSKKVNEITINESPLYSMVSPAVSVLKDGNFIVCWHASEGYYSENIRVQLFDKEGNKNGRNFVLNYSRGINLNPCTTTLGNGNLLISWNYWPNVGGNGISQRDIFGRQIDRFGNPIGDEFRINNISKLGLVHHSQKVAALGDSAFVITWLIGLESIYAKIFTGESYVPEEEPNLLPKGFALAQNFPNPFNEQTKISYELPDMLGTYWVDITMYNSIGQIVRKFHKGWQTPGRYEIIWNGSDEAGNPVANGIYFYQIKVNENRFYQVKKLVYMK